MMSGPQNAGHGPSVGTTSPPDGAVTPPQSPGVVTPPQSPVSVTPPQSPVAVSADEHNGYGDPEQSASCDDSDSQSNTADSQDQDEGHDPEQEAGPDPGHEQDGVHHDAPLFPPPPSEQGTSFNYLQELKSRKMKMKKSTELAKTSKLLKLLRLRAKYRSPVSRGPVGPVVCDGELEGPQLEAYNELFAVSDYADSTYVFSQDTEFIPVPTDSLDLENTDIKDPANHISLTDTPFHCHLCPVAFASELSLRGHMSCHNLQKKFMCPICTKSFAHSSTLNYHIRKHKGDFRYKCDVCGKKFLKPFRLRAHMMSVHTGEKPYSCTVCGKAFASSINLSRHNRVHTGERPFLCLLCGKRFRDNSSFALHRRYHNQNRKFDCDVCGKTFFKLALLRTHKKCVHALERLHPCNLCGKAFKAEEYLRKHKLIHQTEKHYKCEICDASFSRSGLLKKHQYLHTGEEPHKCDICTKGFRDVYTLSKHMRIHARKARKAASSLKTDEKGVTPALLHECDKCGRKYSLPGSLTVHIKKYCKGRISETYGPNPDLHCPGCGKLFQHKQSLAKHMKKTCQVLVCKEDRLLLCSDCGLVFSNRTELAEHFRTSTCSGCEALQTYKCNVCDAEFSHRMTLSKHKKLHGDLVDDDDKKDDESETKPSFPTDEHGRRMFACKYCLETFRSKSALYDTHMRKCHGRPALCKKNECEFCKKLFHSKSDLRAHTRIHTGEKPFACGICGKSFTQRGHVSMHMKIHTGQRDFPCTICGKAFQFATTLRNHVKLHTGERPHVCPVCGKGFIKSNNLKNHLSRHAKRGQLIKQESMEDGQPVMALNQDDLSVMVSPTKFTMMGSLTVKLKKPKKTRRSSRARKGQAMKKLIEEEMNPIDQFDDEMPEIKVEPIEYPEGEEFNMEDGSGFNHLPVKSPESHYYNDENSDEKDTEQSKTLEDEENNLEVDKNNIDDSEYDGEEEEEDESLIKEEDLDLTCPLCGRTFTSQYHLGVHIKTHTGSRPFKCQDCGRSFVQSSHLRSHTQVHGRNKQDYRCLVCAEGFHTVKLLHSHMKVHKGERPYGCYFCDKTYGISQHLRRHVRMVHPDKVDVDMNLLHMPSSALNDGFGQRIELDERGRRIFRCYLCNKFYFKSQHLNRHQRSSHADTLTIQDSVSEGLSSLEESLNGNLKIKTEIVYDRDSESPNSSADESEDNYNSLEGLKSRKGETTNEQFYLPQENLEEDSDELNSSGSEDDVEEKFDDIEIKKEKSDSEYEEKLTA